MIKHFNIYLVLSFELLFFFSPVACAGFILAGAEKKSGGAESRLKGAKFFSAHLPAEIKKVILYLKTGF